MVKLEEILEVPGRYSALAIADEKILARVVCHGDDIGQPFFHVLGHGFNLFGNAGIDHVTAVRKEVGITRYTTITEVSDTLLTRFLSTLNGVVDLTMLATKVGELKEASKNSFFLRFAQELKKSGGISYPVAMTAGSQHFFVVETGATMSNGKPLFGGKSLIKSAGYSSLVTLDLNGNVVTRKISEGDHAFLGSTPGALDLHHHDGSLYVIDKDGNRVQEFDLDLNYVRVVYEGEGMTFSGYKDSTVSDLGIFITTQGDKVGDDLWRSFRHVSFDGDVTDYVLDLNTINGIVSDGSHVFIRSGNHILTYTHDMELVESVEIPELEQNRRFGLGGTDLAYRMESHNGKIYVPGLQHGDPDYHIPSKNIVFKLDT